MVVNVITPQHDASEIAGFTVVVDVFRAFSVAYYIMDNNPKEYVAVDSVELAFELKKKIQNSILIGERNGFKVEGFDYGNSPAEIVGKDFSNKTVIHTTTSGTRGLLKQPPMNDVVVGGFVNVDSIIKYIRQSEIRLVNIYCTADSGSVYGEEDYYFSEYLKSKLLNVPVNFEEIKEKIKEGSGNFLKEAGFASHSDFEMCMEIDKFDYIIRRDLSRTTKNIVYLARLIVNDSSQVDIS